ncbi:MAG: hypothetical protein ACD_75C00494G0003 [uncultured bacterium]|nr:MAG: hypothetical protein ACD_75C00494G0003 [uncultured bacterium]
MQAVDRLADMVGIGRVVQLDHLVGPQGAVLLIEFVEDLGSVALAVGEAVENGQVLALGERAQKGHHVFRGPVKGNIDQRFFAGQRLPDELQAEDCGKAAGVFVPEDVVADEQIAKQPVEFGNTRGDTFFSDTVRCCGGRHFNLSNGNY